MSRLATWAPPILWLTVVLAMSSAEFSAENTHGVLHPLFAWLMPWLTPEHIGFLHGLARKGAHLSEYAILAALWFRAFAHGGASRPAAAWWALAVSVVCAAVDETRQSFVPSRTGSAGDVLIDTVGAAIALVPARLGWWPSVEAATGLLLWLALGGGLVALGLELAAGAGGGLLWVTVPLAAGLLIYRTRRSAARG